MSTQTLLRSKLLTGLKQIAVVIIILSSMSSCKLFDHKTPLSYLPPLRHWLNWNFHFASSFDSAGMKNIRDSYENLLRAKAQQADPTVSVIFQWSFCPCDSFLSNVDATLVGGSGGSVSPPPPVPKTGPSGDYTVSDNLIDFQVSDSTQPAYYDDIAKKISIPKLDSALISQNMIDSRILAIIDTGLDTLAFNKDIRQILWTDPSKPTIFDVVPGHDPYSSKSIYDSNNVKHGTSVAALAYSQITNNTVPRLMVIKAFDQHEQGSIYTVSCALSYAIKKHATFINASWGYFGALDSVLLHYVQTANDNGIPVIGAAGNTPGSHTSPPICNPSVNTFNLLQAPAGTPISHLFYPACFADQMNNVITVNQLQNTATPPALNIMPCFYQDYAEQFVNVGVLNNQKCCGFDIMGNSIEGSSFATPVVTGILMSLTQNNMPVSMKDFVDRNTLQYTGNIFTRRRNYLNYVPRFTIP